MAKDFKKDDEELFKKIGNDEYMKSAVIECYESLSEILRELLLDSDDKESVDLLLYILMSLCFLFAWLVCLNQT